MLDQINEIFQQYGAWGLFTLSFLDSIILPFPPFFLQIAMSLLEPSLAIEFALFAFIGSLLGAPCGFILGKLFGKPLMDKIVPEKWISLATEQMTKNGDAAIIIGSFTPIPFKVFTILSGVLGFSFKKLMVYAVIGRGFKFFLIGLIFHLYGKQAKLLIDEYMDVSLLIVAVLLAVGWLIFMQIRKRRAAKK
ncbi:YqaA family protein [Brevibacillus laterosporus]|uniref:YqaA family protein n=1 Tax=Brevibacillus laterosporus TaxID=1465 RepID=UPI003D1BF798